MGAKRFLLYFKVVKELREPPLSFPQRKCYTGAKPYFLTKILIQIFRDLQTMGKMNKAIEAGVFQGCAMDESSASLG